MPALRRLLPIFPLLLLCAHRAGATGGAWSRLVDSYYFRLGLSSLSADQEYTHTGSRQPILSDSSIFSNGSFGVTDISFYGELGITDWLTAVASTQYKVAVRQAENSAARRDTTASASGLSDLWLDGRIRLLPRDAEYAATATLGVKLPTGSPYQQVPLGSGELVFSANVSGKGRRLAATLNQNTPTFLDSYWLTGGSITYRTGPVEVAAFVTNAFKEKYWESYIEKTTLQLAGLPASDLGIMGEGRRYGVRASLKF